MIRSIYTVNRNMNILQKKQENTSANLANVNTPGYKFQSIVQSTMETAQMVNFAGGRKMNERQELGNYVFGNQIDQVYRNFEQGILSQTDMDTDFAIVGNGFFTIQMDDGQLAYTRNGNFKVSQEGYLITLEGYRVQGQNENGQMEDIYIPNNNFSRDINFIVAHFADNQGLNSIGDSVFTGGQPLEGQESVVRQGYLEMSNISVADEMVKMIEISREFESNQKLLHTADSTLSKAVNEIGRV